MLHRNRPTWATYFPYSSGMHAQSCLILFDPMDCSPPDSSVHRAFQARTRVGCHFLLQGTFPTQGSNPRPLRLPHWLADSLPPALQVSLLLCCSFLCISVWSFLLGPALLCRDSLSLGCLAQDHGFNYHSVPDLQLQLRPPSVIDRRQSVCEWEQK